MIKSSLYREFYKGKKIIVTGHSGFKGFWLSLILEKMGAEVVGISNEISDLSLIRRLDDQFNIKSIIQDVRNYESIKKIFNDEKPDIVFHLAAQALVNIGYSDPLNTFSTNIMGSINIAHSIKETESVSSCIMITSDKCYKNQEWIWGYRENDILGGIDPYSSSKACAEISLLSYYESFKNDLKSFFCTARAGNVVGGGDFTHGRLIPDIIQSLKNGEKFIIRNPNATRPWQHVLEPLSGYLKLPIIGPTLNQDHSSISWNFGPKKESCIKVIDFIKKMSSYFNEEIIIEKNNKNTFYESQLLELNCEKSNKFLNWEPKLNIDQTVEWTGDWYKSFINDSSKIINKTIAQIEEYFDD